MATEKAWLVAEGGPGKGSRIPLTGQSWKIGRIPGQNQVVLDDSEVSRFHANLTISPAGEYWLQDSSSNGTYVNGRRIERTLLHSGDRIRFGLNQANTYVFESVDGESSNAKASSTGTVVAEFVPSRRLPTVVAPLEEAPPRVCRFQLVLDKYALQDVPLQNGRLVVGRTPGAGRLGIDHSSISDPHAEVTVGADGRATLKDFNSLNGTFVNGERTTSKVLEEGDLVQLGACES